MDISPFKTLSTDIIKTFPTDYMHAARLGLTKKLTYIYICIYIYTYI